MAPGGASYGGDGGATKAEVPDDCGAAADASAEGIAALATQAAGCRLCGASAARAVLGRAVTISRERGRPIALEGAVAMVTTHPSYLLRLPDEESQRREYAAMVRDLRAAQALAG